MLTPTAMRSLTTVVMGLVSCALAGVAQAQPLQTMFSYQGGLRESGTPSTGTYDLRFRLYTASSGGSQVGSTLCVDNLSVTDGRFTVDLDFGAQFAGQRRWLEVDVRRDTGLGCGNGTGFTLLTPRQEVLAAPNAVFALNSATASAATNASQLGGQDSSFYRSASNLNSGTIPDAQLASTVARTNVAQIFTGATTFSNTSNTFAGNGAGLTGLNAANIAGGTLADARLSSNVPKLNSASTVFSGALTASLFSGSGAGLTGVNAAQLGGQPGLYYQNADNLIFGTLSDTRLPAGLPRLSGSNTFTGTVSLASPAQIPIAVSSTNTGGSWLTLQNLSVGGREWNMISSGSANSEGAGKWLLRDANAGAIRMSIDTAGRVGIGSSTPTEKLTVESGAIGLFSPVDSKTYRFDYDTVGDYFYIDELGAGRHLAIHNGGNVGIGSTAPLSRLHVKSGSAGAVTPNPSAVATFENSGVSYLDVVASNPSVQAGSVRGILFGDPDNASDAGVVFSEPSVQTGGPGLLQFKAGGGTTHMSLTTDGRLGLGTSQPDSLLHLSGSDPTLRVRNVNDPVGGFVQNTWGALQIGMYNPGTTVVGRIQPGEQRTLLAMDSTGRVGTCTNTSEAPIFRNVIDDGLGYATFHRNVTVAQGLFSDSVFTQNFRINNHSIDNAYVIGESGWDTGYAVVRAESWNLSDNLPITHQTYAAAVGGDVQVLRSVWSVGLFAGVKAFRIDHPLDPENKYLQHSCVESPDMMNVYNGNVVTDDSGLAVVTLPAYFEALNRDFRYQLTVVDEGEDDFVFAKIYRRVKANQFTIRTSKANVEVSWQVTGIRHDALAEKERIQPEFDKLESQRGKYLHPSAFGLPDERGINYRPVSESMLPTTRR